jgi:hypothetical protein
VSAFSSAQSEKAFAMALTSCYVFGLCCAPSVIVS